MNAIRKLHDEAAEAGDLRMVAICEVAMYGEVSERVAEALDAADRKAIARFAISDDSSVETSTEWFAVGSGIAAPGIGCSEYSSRRERNSAGVCGDLFSRQRTHRQSGSSAAA